MARPFDNDQSPLSPMSATSSSTPISYKANVNRNKTKKWADAKPVSYGGDDWGDDDYDLPPPPVSKPTGFRQQGQGVGGHKPDPPVVGTKKTYGDLPPIPPSAASSRPRANSFDADDENRNFSSGIVRKPSPAAAQAPPALVAPSVPAPATRFSQITGVPSVRDPSGPPALSISTQLPAPPAVTGLRKASAASPLSGSPHPDILMSGRVNSNDSGSVVSPVSNLSDARTPSIDYQARRDYSPSAVPPPLHTRGSPAPQSATDSPSTRFPARKSSLSQSTGPDISEITRAPQEQTTSKPWASAPRPASPSAAPRSPSTQGKALPFIRPADIYKRAEEDRERERQSMDSSRPSMDSIAGAKSIDRSDSPAARHQLKEKSSSDSLGAGGRRGTSFDGDDALDSGPPRPTLEPVKERKSEYGLEGYNASEQTPKIGGGDYESLPGRDALDVEEERRQSTSPKLPDLNRISGFGMDIFMKPQPEVKALEDKDTTPTKSSNFHSSPSTDPSLRNQPSLGFNSVVNQAFDRRDDSSVPATPASRSNSEMRRTDSESTGTTGISPIVSRVASTASPESRNRDVSAPSILEVVNETNGSPARENSEAQQAGEISPRLPPTFQPGHRRDISTPSPGNSPARTLDLAKPPAFQPGQEGIISDLPPASSAEEDDDVQLQPPRPITGREHSFRPSLPGGWTSFATTVESETPQGEEHQGPEILNRAQTPPSGSSSVSGRHGDSDLNITPSNTRHPLPQSALGATVLGAAMTGDTREDVAREIDSPAGTPRTRIPVVKETQNFSGDNDLPTPDPSMAPSGSPYSAIALDPRVLPKLETAPQNTQLRPDTFNRAISADSSEPPSPPAKGTTESEDDDGWDESPKPIEPLKQMTLDQMDVDERVEPPFRPQVLPTLSTDTRPQDEESDKLRKEIIKSLSPKPSEEAKHDGSLLSDHLDDESSSNAARISSYLPSEYDNYWATTAEDEPPAPVAPAPAPAPGQTETPMQIPPPATIIVSSPSHTESQRSPETRSYPDTEQTLGAARPPMSQRFSWEASSEDVRALPDKNERGILADDHEQTANQRDDENEDEDEGEAQPRPQPELAPNANEAAKIYPPNPLGSHPATSKENLGRDAALMAGGAAALGGVAAAAYSHQQPQSERRLSLAEEKDPLVSSYPVSPTPPEDQHPSRLSEIHSAPNPDHPSDPSALSGPSIHSAASVHSAVAPSSVSPVISPLQPQSTPAPRIMAFKEIASMQSPYQRIQTFDETRLRFAKMDSGLSNWMSALKAQHTEHSDATASFGGSRTTFPNGSARGKFAKGPGNAAPPLQQPYYQQYLNASSPPAPGTPVSRPSPGTGTPAGSQQSFASAPNKITTQQVSAKGKELLHTAGIFGGKAGKAGKGLLAKGKNKLRGAGGGDKTSSSPPPSKPKNERRTSWGLPVTLTRSGGQADGSSRTSKESNPRPMPSQPQFYPRQRSATLTLDTSHPPVQSSMTAATDDSYDIMSAPGILDNIGMSGALPAREPPVAQKIEPEAPRDIQDPPASDNNESEGQDKLGVPAPIGKNQPSWDPFNATPIAEEEGYQFEGGPQNQSRPMQQAPPKSLPVPPQALPKPKSERSDSGETEFHDAREAPEAPSDLSDWVMVAKDVEPPATSKPAEVSLRSAPGTAKALDLPVLPASILNRPLENGDYADGNSLSVINRSPGDSSTSILNRPRYSYDVPPPAKAMPPPVQATTSPHPQPRAIPLGDRPRYSYDVPRPAEAISPPPPRAIPPESRPPPVNTKFINNARAQEAEQEPASTTSFKGLPPIRRTSTFGIGFGSRQNKKRFPIDDEDESTPRPGQHPDDDIPPLPQTQYPPQQSQVPAPTPPFPERPSMARNGSSDQSQRTVGAASQGQQLYNAPRASDFPPVVDGFRRSQDAWRPNVAPAPQSQLPPQASNVPPPRQSLEQQRSRAPSFTQQPDIIYNERMGKTVLNQQVNPFDTEPPSAARRYPSLFRPGQPDFEGPRDGGDLPAHYYQAPIPREAAFLPRQQTNEYQLPGVGPPADEPRPSSRRNSGLWKELGNKIRSASRERSNSISRDNGPQSPGRYDAQGNEYAESSVTSEEAQEQKKRRGSFFGVNRASTLGMGSPQSRESMVAHNPGSRTDLLNSTQPSPITSPHERKRSFFGNNNSPDPKTKGNKLVRASTSSMSDEPGKKKRFSGLTSMFGRASKEKDAPSSRGSISDRPQATKELSHHERQAIESPAPDQTQFSRQQTQQNPKPLNQQRSFLTKITAGNSDMSRPQQDGKQRQKSISSSGLLSGFMGRRSNQQEKREDSSSQGTRSQGSQPQYRPNQVPPAQTYTDLQENSTPTPPVAAPWQARPEQAVPAPAPETERDRGRRPSREPRYDSVPIPGGYSLVRGEGAVPVATSYDPRGFNRMQQVDPRHAQDPQGLQRNSGPPGGPARISSQQQSAPIDQQYDDRRTSKNRPPNLGPVETFDDYKRSSRRLSREDLLARSPAREPHDQQRPYQLSLPEDNEDRDHPVSLDRDIPIISPPSSVRSPSSIQTFQITPIKNPQHSSIQRLAQPMIRHPQSPAGYPLPDDTMFSPINPSANNLPPPPPPKWPQHLDNQDHHHLTLNSNLDRSNTLRTAVSAISHMSGQQNMLAPQGARDKETGGRDITPSPTPPSPGITPPPQRSPTPPKHSQHGRDAIQTTTLNRGPSPDLYDASPRIPKPLSNLGHHNGYSMGSKHAIDAERERARHIASAQEEKIYYDKDRVGPPSDDEELGPASMSATSYPGQEWNPYAGVYEDEY